MIVTINLAPAMSQPYDRAILNLYPSEMRLNRKVISETLEAVPIENVLLGAPSAEKRLTPKQRKFAEAIAMGESKAGAYRKAYDSKGTPATASRRGQDLTKHSAIAAQIDALRLAEEARKHATPAALRSLVIERLTLHAIDDSINPAQRLRALELLGKVTEVAAFTERREVVTHSDSRQIRERLVESLRAALTSGATDATPVSSLLAELQPVAEVIDQNLGTAEENTPPDSPPTPDPPALEQGPTRQLAQYSTPPIASSQPSNIGTPPHVDLDETPPGGIFLENSV